MNLAASPLNLHAAWLGILLGFASGMVLGLFFHRPDWLGGYGSHLRRLYRLGHISFFGLGATNLFFWLTVQHVGATGPGLDWAAGLFVAGAVTMPLCCVLLAHWPKLHLLFAVPVVSLLLAAGLTFAAVIREPFQAEQRPQLSTSQTP